MSIAPGSTTVSLPWARSSARIAGMSSSVAARMLRHRLSQRAPAARGPRPYRAITSSRRPWSMAWAVIPSRPVIVSAASSALTTAAFDGLDGRLEQRRHGPVQDHPGLDRAPGILLGAGRAEPAVAGREGEEQVARAVGRDGAHPRRAPGRLAGRAARTRGGAAARPSPRITMIEPPPGPTRRPSRAPRRSGIHRLLLVPRAGHLAHRDRLAHRHAVDPQQLPRAVVGLDERAHVHPPSASAIRRDAVPIPPLNSWRTIPVPPPTLPSSTGPPAADAMAASTCSARTWKPLMSLSAPSYVSPTTGSDQYAPKPRVRRARRGPPAHRARPRRSACS